MNNKFKVGDLVMISKSSSWYGISYNNPQDIKGKVTRIRWEDDSLPYYVEWSNRGENGYNASDLILVEDVKEKTIHDILVERSTLEVGDVVKVTHKVPDNDLGWKSSWMGSMYDAIGKECIVTQSPKDSGVRLGALNFI
jgi:signal peptidase I